METPVPSDKDEAVIEWLEQRDAERSSTEIEDPNRDIEEEAISHGE